MRGFVGRSLDYCHPASAPATCPQSWPAATGLVCHPWPQDQQPPPLQPLREQIPLADADPKQTFRVIPGNATQVGACSIYFVLLFKPNRPSLPSYVDGAMGASSRRPDGIKWKTSQRKQERSRAHT